MANPNIDTSPLLKAAKIFSEATRKKILALAGKRMGVAAESVIPEYPRASGKPLPKIYTRTRADGSTYLSAFKNQAMQGAVFALVNAGKIPYVRSGLLGRSFTSAIEDLTGSSVTVKVGTVVKHAPRVVGGDGQQSAYHRGTWWQFPQVMEDNRATIEGEGQKALNAGVEQELKNL
jgi:hypothetical protein